MPAERLKSQSSHYTSLQISYYLTINPVHRYSKSTHPADPALTLPSATLKRTQAHKAMDTTCTARVPSTNSQRSPRAAWRSAWRLAVFQKSHSALQPKYGAQTSFEVTLCTAVNRAYYARTAPSRQRPKAIQAYRVTHAHKYIEGHEAENSDLSKAFHFPIFCI